MACVIWFVVTNVLEAPAACTLTYAQRWRCQVYPKYWKCTRLRGAKTQKPEICLEADDGEDGLSMINVSVNAMSTLIMQETEAISISKVR